jgi:flagellar motor component MotA
MRIFGILFIIIGITLIVCSIITKSLYLGAFVGGGSGGIALGALLFALSWLLKKKKLKEKSIIDDLQPQRDKKYQEAIKQLNNLYQLLNDRMSFDLVEKTFNYVKLNDYLTDGQFQD